MNRVITPTVHTVNATRNFSTWLTEKMAETNTSETKLAEHVGVGAVPGSSFFKEPENRYIRLHFAKKNETLNEALERLSAIKTKMPHA